MSYVDGFVVPVPKKAQEAYLRMARKAARVWRDHVYGGFKTMVDA